MNMLAWAVNENRMAPNHFTIAVLMHHVGMRQEPWFLTASGSRLAGQKVARVSTWSTAIWPSGSLGTPSPCSGLR